MIEGEELDDLFAKVSKTLNGEAAAEFAAHPGRYDGSKPEKEMPDLSANFPTRKPGKG